MMAYDAAWVGLPKCLPRFRLKYLNYGRQRGLLSEIQKKKEEKENKELWEGSLVFLDITLMSSSLL